MEQLVLKTEIVEVIKEDQILLATIANALGMSVFSMYRILAANDVRLTQASILKILRDHLKVSEDKHLLTEMQEA